VVNVEGCEQSSYSLNILSEKKLFHRLFIRRLEIQHPIFLQVIRPIRTAVLLRDYFQAFVWFLALQKYDLGTHSMLSVDASAPEWQSSRCPADT